MKDWERNEYARECKEPEAKSGHTKGNPIKLQRSGWITNMKIRANTTEACARHRGVLSVGAPGASAMSCAASAALTSRKRRSLVDTARADNTKHVRSLRIENWRIPMRGISMWEHTHRGCSLRDHAGKEPAHLLGRQPSTPRHEQADALLRWDGVFAIRLQHNPHRRMM